MPIDTICEGCGKQLRVSEQHAGRKARCPGCGFIYIVPTGPTGAGSIGISPVEDRAREDDAWEVQIADGRVYGPASGAELAEWVAEGRVIATSRLKKQESDLWVPASELFPELDERSASPAPDATEFGRAAPQVPLHLPGHVRSHRGGLILMLGILSFVFCPALGPAALVMGATDIARIKSGTMDPDGRALTMAGLVLGSITTAIGLLTILLAVLT